MTDLNRPRAVDLIAIYTSAGKLEREGGRLRKQGFNGAARIVDDAARSLYEEYDRLLGTKPPRVLPETNEVPF